MVKYAEGFMTEGGRFFDVKEQAELNEAEEDLVEAFRELRGVAGENPYRDWLFEDFLNALNRLDAKVHRYLEARQQEQASHVSSKANQNREDETSLEA